MQGPLNSCKHQKPAWESVSNKSKSKTTTPCNIPFTFACKTKGKWVGITKNPIYNIKNVTAAYKHIEEPWKLFSQTSFTLLNDYYEQFNSWLNLQACNSNKQNKQTNKKITNSYAADMDK